MQQPKAPAVKKFYTLGELAKEVGQKYDSIYNYVRRYNRTHSASTIKLFRLPTAGRTLHILAKDADVIRELFLHPDEYAEPVS